MDILTPDQRSIRMSKIKSKATKPEMLVRRLVHSLGYRYRLHVGDLPGKPDLVFRRKKKVILVNGCFWHHHENCKKARLPKSNESYWHAKILANSNRDKLNRCKLEGMGYRVLVVWECELKDTISLEDRIVKFLD